MIFLVSNDTHDIQSAIRYGRLYRDYENFCDISPSPTFVLLLVSNSVRSITITCQTNGPDSVRYVPAVLWQPESCLFSFPHSRVFSPTSSVTLNLEHLVFHWFTETMINRHCVFNLNLNKNNYWRARGQKTRVRVNDATSADKQEGRRYFELCYGCKPT